MADIPCTGCLSTDAAKHLRLDVSGGITPIMCAADTGHIKCLEQLQLDALPKDLASALYLAVQNGHIECTKSLIKAGAGVNVHNDKYCRDDRIYWNKERALKDDGKRCHEVCMNLLIEAGLDVNKRGDSQYNSGSVPLLPAVITGHNNCVKQLITAKADVNIRDSFGRHLLTVAAMNKGVEITDLLLQAGAEVNAVDDDGCSGLIIAAENNQPDIIRKLVKAGADVNIASKKGQTALKNISSLGYGVADVQLVDLLLEAGADVNMVDSYRENALHCAARHVACQCIPTLLKAGCDVNAVDAGGYTPLMLVVQYTENFGYVGTPESTKKIIETITLLLREGAFINKTDAGGRNALNIYLNFIGTEFIYPAMLLFAAGEDLQVPTIEFMYDTEIPPSNPPGSLFNTVSELHKLHKTRHLNPKYEKKLPDCMLYAGLNLKNKCRIAIRKHLIDLAPHLHLFYRVPQLPLPPAIRDYLLFGMSLDATDAEI